ncbi:MAG: hypothetical protein AB7I35_21615 [Ramlibacter sp.]
MGFGKFVKNTGAAIVAGATDVGVAAVGAVLTGGDAGQAAKDAANKAGKNLALELTAEASSQVKTAMGYQSLTAGQVNALSDAARRWHGIAQRMLQALSYSWAIVGAPGVMVRAGLAAQYELAALAAMLWDHAKAPSAATAAARIQASLDNLGRILAAAGSYLEALETMPAAEVAPLAQEQQAYWTRLGVSPDLMSYPAVVTADGQRILADRPAELPVSTFAAASATVAGLGALPDLTARVGEAVRNTLGPDAAQAVGQLLAAAPGAPAGTAATFQAGASGGGGVTTQSLGLGAAPGAGGGAGLGLLLLLAAWAFMGRK